MNRYVRSVLIGAGLSIAAGAILTALGAPLWAIAIVGFAIGVKVAEYLP